MQYATEAWLFNGWHLETAEGRSDVGTASEAEQIMLYVTEAGYAADGIASFGRLLQESAVGSDQAVAPSASISGGDHAAAQEESSGSARLGEEDSGAASDTLEAFIVRLLGTDLAEAADALRRNGIRLSDVTALHQTPSSEVSTDTAPAPPVAPSTEMTSLSTPAQAAPVGEAFMQGADAISMTSSDAREVAPTPHAGNLAGEREMQVDEGLAMQEEEAEVDEMAPITNDPSSEVATWSTQPPT